MIMKTGLPDRVSLMPLPMVYDIYSGIFPLRGIISRYKKYYRLIYNYLTKLRYK